MELDLDITYILVIALFLVPVLLLNLLVFRPFLRLFEERHDKLEGALQRSERMLDEAEQQAKKFEEQIRAASQQGAELRDEIRREAREAMDERVAQEKSKLDEKLSGALAELKTTHRQASEQMEQKARELANQTASKILGRSVA